MAKPSSGFHEKITHNKRRQADAKKRRGCGERYVIPGSKMKYLFAILVLAISGCGVSSKVPSQFDTSDVTSLSVRGGSYGVSRDSQYYVFFEDDSLPEDLRLRLANYTSYILEYRGMYETSISHVADYYIMVSYQEYDSKSKEQYFQLAAASSKVI